MSPFEMSGTILTRKPQKQGKHCPKIKWLIEKLTIVILINNAALHIIPHITNFDENKMVR